MAEPRNNSGSPRLLILFTLATAVVVGAVLALATGKWWTLLIPVLLHGIATTIVMSGILKALDQGDKPDPVTQARLEDEGAR
jgi:CHASE2 domain-containing sensor protein